MSQLTGLFASSLIGLGLLAGAPTSPQDGLQEAADAVCREAWKANGWDASAIAIAIGDETIFSAARGTTEPRGKDAATADSSLAAAPMAHPFLSALVLQSCARGDLALDDELGKLLPDLVGEDCRVHVRHLMSHTSGFADCESDDPLDVASEGTIWTKLQSVVKEPLVTSPGECVAPTTTDTLLLAAILEHVDKQPIESILKTRLFDALELDDSRCMLGEDEAEVRDASSDELEAHDHSFDPRWIETSAEDLVRFQRALIDYELFGKADYLEMTSPTRLNDGTRSAFGMGLRQISVAGVQGVRAGGAEGELAAMLAYFPEHDMTISVIGRGEDLDAEHLIGDLAMLVIAPPEAPLTDVLLEPDAMKPYLGTFQIGCTSLIIRAGDDGRLILDDAVSGEMTLLNQGDHHFVVRDDPGLQLTFELVGDIAASFVLDDHGVEAVATRFEKGATGR
jgi:CubicO group peptidase (beta-lactamase class C family)